MPPSAPHLPALLNTCAWRGHIEAPFGHMVARLALYRRAAVLISNENANARDGWISLYLS
ncbi:hypothetical protein BH11GEM2_BH11GEM2_05640 [soil metagenome]